MYFDNFNITIKYHLKNFFFLIYITQVKYFLLNSTILNKITVHKFFSKNECNYIACIA